MMQLIQQYSGAAISLVMQHILYTEKYVMQVR